METLLGKTRTVYVKIENADQRRPHIMTRRPDFKLNNNEALLTA